MKTSLDGVFLIEPKTFHDDRGLFYESYNRKEMADLGIHHEFVQDNRSISKKGVLRGLHYQSPNLQAKLVSVTSGTVFDVAVDIRRDSNSFGEYFGTTLSAESRKSIYIPRGFAHGFLALSDMVEFFYKVSDYYSPEHDMGIIWNDPDIAIDWPLDAIGMKQPIISSKDSQLPSLRNYLNGG